MLLEIMKRVITAAVLVPLVLLLLSQGILFVVLVADGIGRRTCCLGIPLHRRCARGRIPRTLVLIAIAVLFAATFRNRSLILPAIGLCSLVLLVVCSFRSPLERVLPDTAFSIFRPALHAA